MLRVHVGPGYREVLPNEPIREGDEYWSGEADQWKRSHNCWLGYPRTPGIFYRRKVETPTTAKPGISPGDGYRELGEGEPLMPGDEVLMSPPGFWTKSLNAETGAARGRGMRYRRKIETPAPVSRPAETYRTSCTAPLGSCSGYATVKAGTPIKAGQVVGIATGNSTPDTGAIKFGINHTYAPVSLGIHWGNSYSGETAAYGAKSAHGEFWTYIYNPVTGNPIVQTTFDPKKLPIGTRLRWYDGNWYRPLTEHDNPKDYRDFWIKEVGTNEFERITWYEKTGFNGETFDNLFLNYTFEAGSPVGARI